MGKSCSTWKKKNIHCYRNVLTISGLYISSITYMWMFLSFCCRSIWCIEGFPTCNIFQKAIWRKVLVDHSRNLLKAKGYYILTGFARRPFCFCGPVANTTVFVKPQSRRASVFFCHSFYASIENVTNCGIWMGIKSIQSWAQIIGSLRWFWKRYETIYHFTS